MTRITSLFFIASVLTAPNTIACRCDTKPPVERAIASSDAVFVGRLTKMELAMRPEGQFTREVVVCTFANAEVLKGADEPTKDMVIVTAPHEASCGYSFRIGSEYLVYATIRRGELETSICDRTCLLESFVLKKGADGSSISDFVRDESGKKETAEVRALMKKGPTRR